ncbi:hypothetical protein SeMB42_g03823 [Synchytrium endobioticum]|uniref:DUF4378 domain-containing protein n=1 Tax=Synchytrium endobioticum TaxID=286115 RepID=A0A507D3L9_9FUNG|nr:hypothetical protein SeMB42_g03823 [Synchytrium endobioticum]TPX48517.1 hypothetical protein SeLEV6574_g02006 [Synchytrium endobioticum]
MEVTDRHQHPPSAPSLYDKPDDWPHVVANAANPPYPLHQMKQAHRQPLPSAVPTPDYSKSARHNDISHPPITTTTLMHARSATANISSGGPTSIPPGRHRRLSKKLVSVPPMPSAVPSSADHPYAASFHGMASNDHSARPATTTTSTRKVLNALNPQVTALATAEKDPLRSSLKKPKEIPQRTTTKLDSIATDHRQIETLMKPSNTHKSSFLSYLNTAKGRSNPMEETPLHPPKPQTRSKEEIHAYMAEQARREKDEKRKKEDHAKLEVLRIKQNLAKIAERQKQLRKHKPRDAETGPDQAATIIGDVALDNNDPVAENNPVHDIDTSHNIHSNTSRTSHGLRSTTSSTSLNRKSVTRNDVKTESKLFRNNNIDSADYVTNEVPAPPHPATSVQPKDTLASLPHLVQVANQLYHRYEALERQVAQDETSTMSSASAASATPPRQHDLMQKVVTHAYERLDRLSRINVIDSGGKAGHDLSTSISEPLNSEELRLGRHQYGVGDAHSVGSIMTKKLLHTTSPTSSQGLQPKRAVCNNKNDRKLDEANHTLNKRDFTVRSSSLDIDASPDLQPPEAVQKPIPVRIVPDKVPALPPIGPSVISRPVSPTSDIEGETSSHRKHTSSIQVHDVGNGITKHDNPTALQSPGFDPTFGRVIPTVPIGIEDKKSTVTQAPIDELETNNARLAIEEAVIIDKYLDCDFESEVNLASEMQDLEKRFYENQVEPDTSSIMTSEPRSHAPNPTPADTILFTANIPHNRSSNGFNRTSDEQLPEFPKRRSTVEFDLRHSPATLGQKLEDSLSRLEQANQREQLVYSFGNITHVSLANQESAAYASLHQLIAKQRAAKDRPDMEKVPASGQAANPLSNDDFSILSQSLSVLNDLQTQSDSILGYAESHGIFVSQPQNQHMDSHLESEYESVFEDLSSFHVDHASNAHQNDARELVQFADDLSSIIPDFADKLYEAATIEELVNEVIDSFTEEKVDKDADDLTSILPNFAGKQNAMMQEPGSVDSVTDERVDKVLDEELPSVMSTQSAFSAARCTESESSAPTKQDTPQSMAVPEDVPDTKTTSAMSSISDEGISSIKASEAGVGSSNSDSSAEAAMLPPPQPESAGSPMAMDLVVEKLNKVDTLLHLMERWTPYIEQLGLRIADNDKEPRAQILNCKANENSDVENVRSQDTSNRDMSTSRLLSIEGHLYQARKLRVNETQKRNAAQQAMTMRVAKQQIRSSQPHATRAYQETLQRDLPSVLSPPPEDLAVDSDTENDIGSDVESIEYDQDFLSCSNHSDNASAAEDPWSKSSSSSSKERSQLESYLQPGLELEELKKLEAMKLEHTKIIRKGAKVTHQVDERRIQSERELTRNENVLRDVVHSKGPVILKDVATSPLVLSASSSKRDEEDSGRYSSRHSEVGVPLEVASLSSIRASSVSSIPAPKSLKRDNQDQSSLSQLDDAASPMHEASRQSSLGAYPSDFDEVTDKEAEEDKQAELELPSTTPAAIEGVEEEELPTATNSSNNSSLKESVDASACSYNKDSDVILVAKSVEQQEDVSGSSVSQPKDLPSCKDPHVESEDESIVDDISSFHVNDASSDDQNDAHGVVELDNDVSSNTPDKKEGNAVSDQDRAKQAMINDDFLIDLVSHLVEEAFTAMVPCTRALKVESVLPTDAVTVMSTAIIEPTGTTPSTPTPTAAPCKISTPVQRPCNSKEKLQLVQWFLSQYSQPVHSSDQFLYQQAPILPRHIIESLIVTADRDVASDCVVLFDATNEAIESAFQPHETWIKKYRNGKAGLKPRGYSWSEVVKLVIDQIQEWMVYPEIHQENLDAFLIKEVKEAERNWWNLESEEEEIKEKVVSLLMEDLLFDTAQELALAYPK